MKKSYNELTPEEIEYVKFMYYEDMSQTESKEVLAKKFGVTTRTVENWWGKHLKLTRQYSTLPQQLQDAQRREIYSTTDILLVTSAQNKTGVNSKFFENLIAYSKYLKSIGFNPEIVIAPTRYRNPTSPSEDKGTEQWWVDEVLPYLHYGKIHFGDCIISTKTRIRPTAVNPLQSMEVLAGGSHLILPHSKIHFKTMPRFKNKPLRTMATTGYITNKNYSETKAGEKGYAHHSYGFVVIEKNEDNTCNVPRNVKVNSDGSFTDIIFEVSKGQVKTVDSCKGIVFGDIHAEKVDREILNNTLEFLGYVTPDAIVVHDLQDGSTFNPHEKKDYYIQRKKIKENRYLMEDEVQHSFDVLDLISQYGKHTYVSISNHDVFLERHINDGNWKNDLHNSPFYLKCAHIQQTQDLEQHGTIYGYLLNEEFKDKPVTYLVYGDSLDIEGYECALHGEHGSNGSRGSYKQFAKLNTKMIHAHVHSPVIYDGVTAVGVTCKLDQYYTRRGMSSWAHAHSIIHNTGKNQLLVFNDNKKLSNLLK